MRVAMGVLAFAAVSACASAQTSSGASPETSSASYWLLLKGDGRTWCGYRDSAEFKPAAASQKPSESARVTYSSDRLTELTYQIEPESGDWIVVDKYTLTDSAVFLRRANLLAQQNLEIIQQTTIRGGKAEPLRKVSVTTLDGKQAEASNIDFPDVPVRTNLTEMPLMRVVAEMRTRGISRLCMKVK